MSTSHLSTPLARKQSIATVCKWPATGRQLPISGSLGSILLGPHRGPCFAHQCNEAVDVFAGVEFELKPSRRRLPEMSPWIVPERCLYLARELEIKQVIGMQMSEFLAEDRPRCSISRSEARGGLRDTRERKDLGCQLLNWCQVTLQDVPQSTGQ